MSVQGRVSPRDFDNNNASNLLKRSDHFRSIASNCASVDDFFFLLLLPALSGDFTVILSAMATPITETKLGFTRMLPSSSTDFSDLVGLSD